MKKVHKTWVEVSKSALMNNVRAFRRHIGRGVSLMAVVKANAYGHGLLETARIADTAGAAWFGVDSIDEAIILRKHGIAKPILVLGYTLNDRLADCIAHRVSFTVYNLKTVKALHRLKRKPLSSRSSLGAKAAFVHIKIETGTTRQGVHGEDLRTLARALQKTPGVVIEGVSTHYANSEEAYDRTYVDMQRQRFHEALEILKVEGIDPPWKHTACSAATILYPETRHNLVRVGVSMYGLWPSIETSESTKAKNISLELKPVLSWKTVVAQLKSVKKDTPVSYDLTERLQRDSVLAVIPVGYSDGFDRGLSSIGEVLIDGRRCRVVGRVCMNMCMVDVTDVSNIRVEDEAVIIGTQKNMQVDASEIATKIHSINYEVISRINPLLPRYLTR